MNYGQFVFPGVILGFLLFLGSFLATTPATPAPEFPGSRLMKVQGGDVVVVEVSGFYGPPDDAWVFFSTQEERRDELKVGRIEPQFQTSPVSYRMAPSDATDAPAIDRALLGHRAGDTVTTEQIPARLAFGDWEENLTMERAVADLPSVLRFNSSTVFGPGQSFNLTEYLGFWQRAGHDLREGYVWKCEEDTLWDCRVEQVLPAQNEIVVRRLVNPSEPYPVRNLLGQIRLAGDLDWSFAAVPQGSGERFSIRLDPPVGVRFQLRDSYPGLFDAGTYEVVQVTDLQLFLRYSSVRESDPDLVGEAVVYELHILRIDRSGT